MSAGSCEDCGPYVYDPEDLEVVGVQMALLDEMLLFSEYYELRPDECNHIRGCPMEYLSAILCAGGN